MSELIRVCLVSVNSYPLFNEECTAPFGGAEVQVYLLAKSLAQDANYKVVVIVGDFGQPDVEYRNNAKLVKVHSRKGGITGKLLAPVKFLQVIGKINPDVIIQRASGPETGICAFYSRRKKKHFIYSVASDAEMVGKSVASKHPLYKHLYEYGVKRADKIVVQSARQLQELSLLSKDLYTRASVINNSIEITADSGEKRQHILWVGRGHSVKRPQLFISLARGFPEEKFVMVMPVSYENEEMKRIEKQAENEANIHFISRVDYHASQSLYNNAKMLVNTSSTEGFPNTFLQAGIASIPIVSLIVDPDSFIEKNGCGYVCGDDLSNLGERVRYYLDNADALKSAGINCHDYILKHHDIRENIKVWKKLISE